MLKNSTRHALSRAFRPLTQHADLLQLISFPSCRACWRPSFCRQDSQADGSYWSIHLAEIVQPSGDRGNVRQQRKAGHIRTFEPHLQGRVHFRGGVYVVQRCRCVRIRKPVRARRVQGENSSARTGIIECMYRVCTRRVKSCLRVIWTFRCG